MISAWIKVENDLKENDWTDVVVSLSPSWLAGWMATYSTFIILESHSLGSNL